MTRWLLIAMCVLLLAYGIFAERHRITPFSEGEAAKDIGGPAFTEGCTYDAFLAKEGKLYDIYSLEPGRAGEKDCKT